MNLRISAIKDMACLDRKVEAFNKLTFVIIRTYWEQNTIQIEIINT